MKAATDKQIGFIKNLLATREHSYEIGARLIPEDMSTKEASDMIGDLLNAPYKKAAEQKKLEPGVYRHNGEIYVVKPNREATALYAKKLIEIGGRRLTETGGKQQIDFQYAPGVVRHIRPEEKLTLAEGAKLTVLYGRCICCGRFLKAADSVEKGIGPVCRKLFASF